MADKIQKAAKEHSKMSMGDLHKLRIAFKELRYATECLAPILSHEKRIAYLSALTRIQDLLGILNDQVTASRFIEQARPQKESAILFKAWLTGRISLLISIFGVEIKKFRQQQQPWN